MYEYILMPICAYICNHIYIIIYIYIYIMTTGLILENYYLLAPSCPRLEPHTHTYIHIHICT